MSLEDLVKDGIKNIPAYIPGDTAESVEKKYGIAPEDILKLASRKPVRTFAEMQLRQWQRKSEEYIFILTHSVLR